MHVHKYIQLYSPLLVEKNKQQKSNDKKSTYLITLTIQLSSSCYYIDFHTQKSEQTNKYP